jgi:hypothetical protein
VTRAAAALAALLAACGIDSRSQDYECTQTADCTDGRVCRSGWCVVGSGGAGADAGPPATPDAGNSAPDASSCPAGCTRCEDDTCVVECIEDDSCGDPVVCPPGLPCLVVCEGIGSCAAGIDCSAAASCDLRCTSREACNGEIRCGEGRCSVTCSARDTCAGGVDCTDSCACETSCDGVQACALAPECPFPGCFDGDDCAADGLVCDFCE